jgi:chromosome segregation ATPase
MFKKDYESKLPLSPHIVYKELFITEPTRVNLELNNELNYTRELISKVSKMMNNEKIKNDKLEGKFNTINDELNKLKQTQSEMDKTVGTVIVKKNSEIDISDSLSLTEDEGLDLSLSDDDHQIDTETDIQFPVKVTYNSNANSAININLNNKSPIDLLNKQSKNSFISNYNSHTPNPVKITNHKKSSSFIPKLNFKIIQDKYQTEALKEKANLNNSNIADKKRGSQGSNKPEDESAKIIEKLKNEIRLANIAIKEMKEKLEKFKNAYKSTRAKLKFANKNLKISNNKISNLEAQIKKVSIASMTLGGQSTDDLSNKRVENINTSMVCKIKIFK